MHRLFTTLRLSSLELPNRVLMAPMTRNRAYDGVPTDLHAEYYAQRASAGLIVTEATYIHPIWRGYPGEPGIHSAAEIAGWKKVTEAVHAAGGRIYVQLHHTGRMAHTSFLPGDASPVAPSAVAAAGDTHLADGTKAAYSLPRALGAVEIPAIIEEFGRAAGRAMEAGFDGVELHGANGYLPHAFLGTNTNLRGDNAPNRPRDWRGTHRREAFPRRIPAA
jgi:N-ethylmaleimide reductase